MKNHEQMPHHRTMHVWGDSRAAFWRNALQQVPAGDMLGMVRPRFAPHLYLGHVAVCEGVVDLQAAVGGRQGQVAGAAQQLPRRLVQGQAPRGWLHALHAALHLTRGIVHLRTTQAWGTADAHTQLPGPRSRNAYMEQVHHGMVLHHQRL